MPYTYGTLATETVPIKEVFLPLGILAMKIRDTLRSFGKFALFLLPFMLLPFLAWGAEGSLYSTVGPVEVLRAKESLWIVANKDFELNDGDTVRTGVDGRAGVALKDGSLIRLGPSSVVTVRGKEAKKEEGVFLKVGKLFFFSRGDEHTPEVRTPTVSAAIRGTEFTVEVVGDESIIAVLDGRVECYNQYGSVPASNGELVTTKLGQAPVKSLLVRPKEKVQWALHVPPILSTLSSNTPKEVSDKVNAAYLALTSGEFERAVEIGASLNSVSPSTGRSLQSLAAILKDEKDTAVKEAYEAVRADPSSELAVITLSYALQSQGSVEGALDTIETFSKERYSPFFLTRRAELKLARNDVRGAALDIEKAMELNPRDPTTLAYALATKGFIALIESEPEAAEGYFKEAIGLDETYPAAHLGKGLALTQQGEVEAGSASMATAVHLAPTTSIYRSYLGKALFERNKNLLSKEEFQRAIELDPNDPTPLLYRSFQRLAENNPVEALDDLTASAKLNGNRAVYRSSLLLDQDQAVRKASLAEVFSALGFGEVARVQALSSISEDYTNFSGHRYLANAYTSNFQFEAGRSERALANVLAPLGFNSLQPIAQNSFGDYTTLFERNEQRTALTHGIDSQLQRFEASVTQSGREGEVGYFLNGSGLYNDYSPNSVQLKDGFLSAALQYQPTSSLRTFLLTDFKGRQVRTQPFELGAESDQLRSYSTTLGATYKLDPEWSILSVGAFQYANNSIRQPRGEQLEITGFTEEGIVTAPSAANLFHATKQTPDQFQLSNQLLYHGDWVTLTAGQELFLSRVSRRSNSTILDDELGVSDIQGLEIDSGVGQSLRNSSYFTYSTFHLGSTLDVTVGGAYTSIESEDLFEAPFSPNSTRQDRFNPKGGITWRPTNWATVRAAYIESMERTILEGLPSYEPSVVGAVNQRYFDFPHTFSRNTTVALDLNPTSKTFFGFEATHRDLELLEIASATYAIDLTQEDSIPTTIGLSERADVYEDVDILSSYYYQVLTNWLVSTVDYRYSLNNRFDPFSAFRIETHRGTVGLKAFDASGWFVKTTGTYLDQQRTRGGEGIDGATNGFLVDLGLGYRLPERHGIVQLDFRNLLDQKVNVNQLLEVDTVYLSGFGVGLTGTYNF